jgi:hypothetical protein
MTTVIIAVLLPFSESADTLYHDRVGALGETFQPHHDGACVGRCWAWGWI